MQPSGILAVLNDIDAACHRAEYDDWYQRDHMPDRLAVPGFRHARRYRRTQGDAQEFFTFYETATPGVLRSPAYLARLAAPTPGTVAMMRHFRAMCRSICTVASDAGGGIGGTLAVLGAATPIPPADLATLIGGPVCRARLWIQAEDIASNPEAALRPGADMRLGAILVIEGTTPAPVLAAARQAAATLGLPGTPSLYSLLYASPQDAPAP